MKYKKTNRNYSLTYVLDLRLRLKVATQSVWRRDVGSWCHTCGPATEKALEPIDDNILGTSYWSLFSDHRCSLHGSVDSPQKNRCVFSNQQNSKRVRWSLINLIWSQRPVLIQDTTMRSAYR